jgi:antitoxin component YwqK of YwqJK toxin-antitoxin module
LKADAESSSKYLDQPKYEGEMKNGLKHGKGTYYFENGNRF